MKTRIQMKRFTATAVFTILFLALGVQAYAQDENVSAAMPELEVVDSVDIERYLGTWYEIAKIPTWFERSCAGGTTATYTLNRDGSVNVLNQCYRDNGMIMRAQGNATVADAATNAKLNVSFVNFFGRWLFPGDYWIIELGDDYEYAVVGHPTREYGWILSRTCELPEDLLNDIFYRLSRRFYSRDDFDITDQSQNGCDDMPY